MRRFNFLTVAGLLLLRPAATAATPMALDSNFLQDAGYLLGDPIRIYLALASSVGYDSNIFESAKNQVDSIVSTVSPELSALLPYSNGALQFDAQANQSTYSASSADNFTDRLIYSRGSFDVNSRNHIAFNGEICRCHDARGTVLTEGFDPESTTVDTPDAYIDKTAYLNYEFGARSAPGRIRFSADYLDHRYDNHLDRTRYFDRTEFGYGTTFLLQFFPGTALAFEGRERHIEYEDIQPGSSSLDSRESSLLIGADWEATRATSGSLRIGRDSKNFDAADRGDGTGLVWELGTTWRPRTYSSVVLTVKRAPSESNGFGDFIDTKAYSVKWSQAWWRRIGTDLTLSYLDQTYHSFARDEQTKELTFGIRYEMRRWLTLRFDSSWRDRASNLDALQFERSRYWLTAEISL